MNPLCFVLMPFGTKQDAAGASFDFDAIYERGIRPAIEDAGLCPIRADEERTGGIIHKPMFERLLLCEFAIADLTTANANVFYELGIRHAARPATTLPIFTGAPPPFDLGLIRALPYKLGPSNAFGDTEATALREAVTKRLLALKKESRAAAPADSPLFQLLSEYKAPDIARLKTDVFRDWVEYEAAQKSALSKARRAKDPAAVEAVVAALSLDAAEAGVLVDAFLSFRALKAWDAMASLFEKLPAVLKRSVLMREQLAFALNRAGKRDEALEVLRALREEQTSESSETLGLLGRIHKDQWRDAVSDGEPALAAGFLDEAIEAYSRGFEADSRDAYPGINAVTLLDIQGSEASLARKSRLLPVVAFAVQRRLASSKPDYWDHATLLELAVLADDEAAAKAALPKALASVRETWEPETTANNLTLLSEARKARGVEQAWLSDILGALDRASKRK